MLSPSLSNLERQQQILRQVEQAQRVTVASVCAAFSISEATARRDLDLLAGQGKIRRVHGGAIAVRAATAELPVIQRMGENREVKQRLGKAAAGLVCDGDTLFLGSGTTMLEVARNLGGKSGLTVITNSLLAANELVAHPEINLILLGGELRQSELSMLGHLTEQALAELRADRVILGIHALDVEAGLTSQYLPETITDRKILQLGREVILAADSSKCGRVSPAFVAPIQAVDILITDENAPAGFVQAARARGVRVVLA